MSKHLTKDLIDFGLSEKEAKIYICLLELEIATAREISQKSGVNRSSAYVVIESLQTKGLVGTSDKNGILSFIASSPDILQRSASASAFRQNDILKRIETIVPELKSLHKGIKQKPKVRVFEGKEGLINAFNDALNQKEKKIRVVSNPGNLMKIIPKKFFLDYVKRKNEKEIHMFGIHPNGILEKLLFKLNTSKFDRNILIDRKKFNFSADIAIYDNKVGYMSKENGGLAITIENDEVAESMKQIFDLAYAQARTISKFKSEK
jgi:HTH-type transcriptional regulator, sugar sensing transcriptional regulator